MRLLLVAALFALAAAAHGAEVAGVTMPASEQIAPGAPKLALNGAGLRRKFIFKVYVIGLYLVLREDGIGRNRGANPAH